MQMRPSAFTPEQKVRNFDYYEALTVRDSSLSACTQAVIAAEVGQLELAYDYLAEAALMDLQDREHNTRDGLHMASLAGAWTALVAGFGGMRCGPDVHGMDCVVSFRPRLPPGLARLAFRVRYRGRLLKVETRGDHARYSLLGGDPMELSHHGETFTLGTRTISKPIPPLMAGPRPVQPPGRAPHPHGTRD
jgi:alpha,alpha-trehalose phosphorylase